MLFFFIGCIWKGKIMDMSEQFGAMPAEGFIRLPTVLRILGVGRTSWWNGIKVGRYPKPVKLGPRTAVWRVEDIRALIASFAEKSDEQ